MRFTTTLELKEEIVEWLESNHFKYRKPEVVMNPKTYLPVVVWSVPDDKTATAFALKWNTL